jgi:hypothetical protein
VLIRSPDLYYRISGSLSAGIFLVLLLAAGAATNQDEGVAPAPTVAPPQAAVPTSIPGHRRLPGTRVAWGLALGLVLGLSGLRRRLSAAIPSGRLIEGASFPTEAAAVVVAFLPAAARTPAEYAVAALSLAALVAGLALLAALFLRDNPLAWLVAGWFGLGGVFAVRLLSEPSRSLEWSGALLAVVLLATAVWLWGTSGRAAAPQ